MKSHKNMKSWKIGSKNFEKKSAKGFLISYYSMLISISNSIYFLQFSLLHGIDVISRRSQQVFTNFLGRSPFTIL